LARRARIEHLYAIADGQVVPEPGEPTVIFCMDEFEPLNLHPRPGRQWTVGGKGKDPIANLARRCAPPTPAPRGYSPCSPR
jgi:hypothetical protein